MIEKQVHVNIQITNPKVTPTTVISNVGLIFRGQDQHSLYLKVPTKNARLTKGSLEFDCIIELLEQEEINIRAWEKNIFLVQLIAADGEQCNLERPKPPFLGDDVVGNIELNIEEHNIYAKGVSVNIIFDDGLWVPAKIDSLDVDKIIGIIDAATKK